MYGSSAREAGGPASGVVGRPMLGAGHGRLMRALGTELLIKIRRRSILVGGSSRMRLGTRTKRCSSSPSTSTTRPKSAAVSRGQNPPPSAGQRCSRGRRRPGPAGMGWDRGRRWLGGRRWSEGGGWQTFRRRRSTDWVSRRKKMETGKIVICDFANRPSSSIKIRYCP
jgi:hypothetical protein